MGCDRLVDVGTPHVADCLSVTSNTGLDVARAVADSEDFSVMTTLKLLLKLAKEVAPLAHIASEARHLRDEVKFLEGKVSDAIHEVPHMFKNIWLLLLHEPSYRPSREDLCHGIEEKIHLALLTGEYAESGSERG